MNNLYVEKEKGWRTRVRAVRGGAGAAIQPGCGVERGSDKATLWVPSRHALTQGSLGFLSSQGEEFNLGPETRHDCSEL